MFSVDGLTRCLVLWFLFGLWVYCCYLLHFIWSGLRATQLRFGFTVDDLGSFSFVFFSMGCILVHFVFILCALFSCCFPLFLMSVYRELDIAKYRALRGRGQSWDNGKVLYRLVAGIGIGFHYNPSYESAIAWEEKQNQKGKGIEVSHMSEIATGSVFIPHHHHPFSNHSNI